MAQSLDYVLLKYSRSYSPADSARFSNQPTSSDSEWQHFANPKLQLFLGNANPTRSASIKIFWVPGGGGELQHVQQDSIVILEDINLSSFSPPYINTQKFHSQSPPLKVVYRDSVVGFRYLHPRIVPPGALSTFRRFQICFTDPLLATQFVNSIRHVCPCKASLPATLASSRTMAITTHPIAPLGSSLIPVNESHFPKQLPPLTSQHAAQTPHLGTRASVDSLSNHDMESSMLLTNGQAIKNKIDNSGLPLCGSTISSANTVVVATSGINCSRQVSQTPGQPPPPPITACSYQEGRERHDPDQSVVHPRKSCSTAALSAGSSDPSSRSGNSTQRYVASSIDSAIGASSSTPNLTKEDDYNCNLNDQLCSASQAATFPDSPEDHCSVKDLCAMPMKQLERLIGEVIREPDFVNLMEKLDTMWQAKGIITKS